MLVWSLLGGVALLCLVVAPYTARALTGMAKGRQEALADYQNYKREDGLPPTADDLPPDFGSKGSGVSWGPWQ
jgi:hypothetical protein